MNIHLWTFVFQIVNFVVVAFVLHRLLYRPLYEAIDRRRQATLAAQTAAERAKQDAEALRAGLEAERADAERRREESVREAHRQAEAEAERLLEDARRLAQQRSDDAGRELAERREQALAALRREIVQMALDTSERFLRQSADRTLQRQLVARLVESLAAVSADERRQLSIGRSLGEPAVIEAAEELDRESLEIIAAAVAQMLGERPTFEVKLRPSLVSGVCLRLGGHVWDASLGGSLEAIGRNECKEVAHA
ncbi:MAG TPA: F0F1 ATP synthase subunit delta [Pirellulales bacterium]|nr:F0F1 ATP synthase subunit delta [Pirellulales bacterium]